MKPQQKAKQLFYKMHQEINETQQGMDQNYAAFRCSLIAVDEVLTNINETFQGFLDADLVAYWQLVKKELNRI
jgi:hypothetical protein